jgi:GNAT superfamily N-acetyltransferase
VGYTVERVPAAVTWALRQAVLRPHRQVEEVALSDDDEPTTASFAAVDRDGAVLSTARVALAAPPDVLEPPAGAASWQLRGLATRPDLRGRGIGTAVLEGAVAHVARCGGGLLWCNARLAALPLYRRAGFAPSGEAWDDPEIGRHIVMWRLVATPGAPPTATGAPSSRED